jgi:hypothetical protein
LQRSPSSQTSLPHKPQICISVLGSPIVSIATSDCRRQTRMQT